MTLQQPLPSGFGAHTTARDIVGARRLGALGALGAHRIASVVVDDHVLDLAVPATIDAFAARFGDRPSSARRTTR